MAFTSPDRVGEVLHNFNDDGFASLEPKCADGRPPTFTLPERREIRKLALSRAGRQTTACPSRRGAVSKLAELLVAEGVADDISHEGLRALLREEGVSFQVIKTQRVSSDPDFEAKKNRVLALYDTADGKAEAGESDPSVVFGMDELGPSNLFAPARQAVGGSPPARCLRPRRQQDLRARQDHHDRTKFLELCRYLRSLHPPEVRIAIVMGNFSPHLSTKRDQRVGQWAAANNVELAYVPTNASWLNRTIEARFQALRYFALAGTDHRSHDEQSSMIRRYSPGGTAMGETRLCELVKRATFA